SILQPPTLTHTTSPTPVPLHQMRQKVAQATLEQYLAVPACQGDSPLEGNQRSGPALSLERREVILGKPHRDEDSQQRHHGTGSPDLCGEAGPPGEKADRDPPGRTAGQVPPGTRRQHLGDPAWLGELVR